MVSPRTFSTPHTLLKLRSFCKQSSGTCTFYLVRSFLNIFQSCVSYEKFFVGYLVFCPVVALAFEGPILDGQAFSGLFFVLWLLLMT